MTDQPVGYVIQWEGLAGHVVREDEQVSPHPYQRQRVFDTEHDALVELVGDLDEMIDVIRSARRTATKRLRQLVNKG